MPQHVSSPSMGLALWSLSVLFEQRSASVEVVIGSPGDARTL